MGLFDKLRNAGDIMETDTGLSSPWADRSSLATGVIIAEALGIELSKLPLGRDSAIQLPPVARLRNLLVSSIAPLPLVAMRGAARLEADDQPTFLYRTDAADTPYDRMAWTVDDLLFHGSSLWALQRGAASAGAKHGPILDAVRVPWDAWTVKHRRVHVELPGVTGPADPAEVLVFAHPSRGLLRDASTTLRAAEAIERAYTSRARNPIPLTVIRHATGSTAADELTEPEITNLLDQWAEARRGDDGALGYLPPSLVLETPGADVTSMLENARNASRIDIANHGGVPVSMLDGGVAEESMTYRNATGEVSRFYTETLAYWLDPIAARLSQDDVVPRGQSVRFDLSKFDQPAPPATGVPVED